MAISVNYIHVSAVRPRVVRLISYVPDCGDIVSCRTRFCGYICVQRGSLDAVKSELKLLKGRRKGAKRNNDREKRDNDGISSVPEDYLLDEDTLSRHGFYS